MTAHHTPSGMPGASQEDESTPVDQGGRAVSRREFSVACGLTSVIAGVAAASPGEAPSEKNPGTGKLLQLQPRYHRWHVDPGVRWVETNTGYATLDWSIPREQVALVLVDVWDHHYLEDTEARTEVVIERHLLPLLRDCREQGLTVIHAPSPEQARPQPNWVGEVPDLRKPRVTEDWPPPDFRRKAGPYRAFARPVEPREPELVELRRHRQLHPLIRPVAGEPVVANGDELHHYCRQRGILFLLYAGFNTNACILVRDYGTLAMSSRGYEVILVRDATTGMETRETQPNLAQTRGATLFLEMFGQYSVASAEVRRGLSG